MRERLTYNFGLKILSLALAVLVWLVVLSIEDPVYTREFSDISVTEINGDQITEAGKAYSYVGGNTVSVKVKGKTSIVNRLSKDDLLAVADLSTLSITGAVMVDVSCPKYPNLEITPIGSSTVLKVEIEDLVEKSLNIKVVTSGKVASGYYIGQGVATPNMVTVSGPKSVVDQIAEANVSVTVGSSNTSDITTNTTLKLLDQNGSEVSSSTLNISQSDISVNVPIYQTKTVPVNFGVTGRVAEGYRVVSAVYEPKKVTVAGRKEDLDKIDQVTLKDYDISGKNDKIEDSVSIAQNIAEQLPDGVVFTDKEATVALVVDIQKITETSFELPLSKVSLKGSSTDYTYEKSVTGSSDKAVTLKVKGIASEVNALTADNLTALIDVSDYGEGEYNLPLTVIFDDNLELAEDAYVHVVISKSSGE